MCTDLLVLKSLYDYLGHDPEKYVEEHEESLDVEDSDGGVSDGIEDTENAVLLHIQQALSPLLKTPGRKDPNPFTSPQQLFSPLPKTPGRQYPADSTPLRVLSPLPKTPGGHTPSQKQQKDFTPMAQRKKPRQSRPRVQYSPSF